MRRQVVCHDAPREGEGHTGGCLCGAVRYSVRGEPLHVVRCHCADCRKESGSAFSVYAQWQVQVFEVTGGDRKPRRSRLLSTMRIQAARSPDLEDGIIEIRIGSLDDAPSELTPRTEIWVKRRESWIPPVDGAAQHDENRP